MRSLALSGLIVLVLIQSVYVHYSVGENANSSFTISGCPVHFARRFQQCTMLNLQPVSWTDGEAFCAEEGAKLAAVKNVEQFEDFISITQQLKNTLIGLKYTISDRKWHWSDGTVFNPATDWAPWMSGVAPKEPTRDTCIVWRLNAGRIGWKPMSCSAVGMPLCIVDATTPTSNCPPEFIQEGDLCLLPILRRYNSPVRATSKCNGYGAEVVSPKTFDEYASFISLPHVVHLSRLSVPIWLGLKYISLEGTWKWGDRTEAKISSTWMPWRNRPGTLDHDACVLMVKTPTGDFEWTLEDCRSEIGFVVCSTSVYHGLKTNTDAMTYGSNCPPTFIENSGICLHAPKTLSTWREAQTECLKFKSNLLMVKSDFELKALMAGAGSQVNNVQNGFWIGLNRTKSDGKYHWFDGREYHPDKEWSMWAPGEPAVDPGKDQCIWAHKSTMSVNAKLGWSMADCDNPSQKAIIICFMLAGINAD